MKYTSLRFLLSTAFIAACAQLATAQTESLDKISAIVGDKIILRSELEAGFLDYKRENPDLSDTVKCKLLEDYLSQKILVEQADRDSVIVTDEEVEGSLDNRIRYFISLYGSEEKLRRNGW
jgi:peptidyl-prolyl cis-trans isomerase SurA